MLVMPKTTLHPETMAAAHTTIDKEIQTIVRQAKAHYDGAVAAAFEAAMYEEANAYLASASAEDWRAFSRRRFSGLASSVILRRVAARPDAAQWQ